MELKRGLKQCLQLAGYSNEQVKASTDKASLQMALQCLRAPQQLTQQIGAIVSLALGGESIHVGMHDDLTLAKVKKVLTGQTCDRAREPIDCRSKEPQANNADRTSALGHLLGKSICADEFKLRHMRCSW